MPSVIKLRCWQVRKYMALKGLQTKTALADAMGIDRATVQRVLNGDALPGTIFIAAALDAFPELAFEDLFDLVAPDVDSAATDVTDDTGIEHEVPA
jgi:transcriptional regulator with XRE-family HTH domain